MELGGESRDENRDEKEVERDIFQHIIQIGIGNPFAAALKE